MPDGEVPAQPLDAIIFDYETSQTTARSATLNTANFTDTQVTYTVTVKIKNDFAEGGVGIRIEFTDQNQASLPKGLVSVSAEADNLTDGVLAAQGEAVYTITYTLTPDLVEGDITNQAIAFSFNLTRVTA